MLDSREGVCAAQGGSKIQLLPYPLVTSTLTVERDLRKRPLAQRFPAFC
jgi:hypothetical protein